LRKTLATGLLLVLSGCVSERHFASHALWPFGNPNAPPVTSETAQRALGHDVSTVPLQPQPGNVWPGPVKPMPTLSEVEKYANMPLGQGYMPSLPSPYPPGEEPPKGSAGVGAPSDGELYKTINGIPQIVPAAPGHIR
jgi:hypothetical protein